MSDINIAIKGVKDGLLITLDEEAEWGAVTADLASRLDEKSAFFAGASVTLDLGERPVAKDQMSGVKALLERRGMLLHAVTSASMTSLDAASALDLRAHNLAAVEPEPEQPAFGSELPYNSEEDGMIGVLIRRTLRSGKTVTSRGHVVILGDVNPGSEIVAVGDVIVWGKLRGRVHAGCEGDEQAVVCALDMQPTQLRIAGYIAISPSDKRRKPKPETALIRDRQIVVDEWTG
jgi:septum site-determining protein MinC